MIMWIVAVFDLPVQTSQERRSYRILRKKLLASGFKPIQRSLLWRWVENRECADALTQNIKKSGIPQGQIAFFYIPDVSFKNTELLDNGILISPPSPPHPWTILT